VGRQNRGDRQAASDSKEGIMSAFGLFSSIDQVNHAARLEGESYMALFGSVSVDFTRERLAPGDHTIAVTALFGSVKLVFPADVEVRTEGLQVFGSSELKDLREGAARAASDTRVTVQATSRWCARGFRPPRPASHTSSRTRAPTTRARRVSRARTRA
jgi:hypothetical protein